MDHLELDDPFAIRDIITDRSALPFLICDASNDRPGIQTIPVVASNDTLNLPSAMAIPYGKVRQISEKDWDGLKNDLHTFYTQQNMTMGDIIKLMREKHNILVTKKQLTLRFAKWHFKKNVKRAEIETFLQNSTSFRGKAQTQVDGVRISAAKRKRWQKRADTKPHEESQGSATSLQLSSRDTEIYAETLSIGQHKEETPDHPFPSMKDNSSTHSPSSLSLGIIGSRPLRSGSVFAEPQSSSRLSSKTIQANVSSSTLFPDRCTPVACGESYVDEENGSPKSLTNFIQLTPPTFESEESSLFRLFSALSLAPPDEIKLFYQSAFATEKKLQDTETISNEEFLELTKDGGDRSLECTQMVVHSPMSETSGQRTALSAFNRPDMDVIFPSQVAVFANSLGGELYPFPRHENPHLETESLVVYPDHDARLMLREGKQKVKKLETCFPEDNPGVVASNYHIAVAYLKLGYYEHAEKQFKRILPILVQRYGFNSRYVVTVKRDLSEAILYRGRFTEANQLAQEVHTAALGIDVPYGHLTQQSLQVLAQSYGSLGESEKEEEVLRKLVQIKLVASGPKHGDTLAAIRSLADSITDSERYYESEELLRVALDLSQSAHGFSELGKYLILRKLAILFYKQKRKPECKALYKTTIEMSGRLLGSEHPDDLKYVFWSSQIWNSRGFRYKHRLKKQTDSPDTPRVSTIDALSSLNFALLCMKKVEIAEMWIGTALQCGLETPPTG